MCQHTEPDKYQQLLSRAAIQFDNPRCKLRLTRVREHFYAENPEIVFRFAGNRRV